MKLIIEDDEGRKTVVPLVREEITIGRQDGNTIRLTERNVSRRHARLVRNNGSVLIEDLGSYNGVRVNGEKIQGPTRIKEGDLVEIGDYDLGVEGKFDATATPAAGVQRPGTLPPGQMARPAPKHATLPPTPPPAAPRPQEAAPPAPAQATLSPADAGATSIIRVSDLVKAAPQVEARELPRSEMPRLVGIAGQFRGKEFYLMRTEVKFGRTDENDIVVDHQSVSRSHARFVLDGGQWKVIDNKSANGVRLNGEDYAIANLKPGDVLELGHLKFRFCAPGEKFAPPKEAGEEGKGGPKPTTAELIAGAQGRGPSGATGKKPGPPLGLVAGIAAAVVVAGALAYFALGRSGSRRSGSGEPVGAEAVKQGDALFKQHKYRAAMEKYDLAGDAPAPNRKKAADEARGEDAYGSMKQAVEAGDGDKARNLFEKCSPESGYWCQKAAEMKDQVAATYARKHLAAASAAKTAGKLEQCQTEAGNVIGFDPANAEAQSLQSQCQPQAAAEPRPAPEKREGPSARDREAKAARLAKSANDKLNAHQFKEAVKDAGAALAQKPGDKATQASAWRTLGYANAYLTDIPAAKKYLKLYQPFCAADCAQVEAFLAR